jgi:hypothetical protein
LTTENFWKTLKSKQSSSNSKTLMSSELGAMREIKSRAALLQGFPKERKPLSQLALYFI